MELARRAQLLVNDCCECCRNDGVCRAPEALSSEARKSEK